MSAAQFRAMDADQIAVWVCLNPSPKQAEREALRVVLAEMGVRV